MSLQNDLQNLTKVKGCTHLNEETPPTSISDYDTWWDATNQKFRVRKNNKWLNDYGYGYSCGGYYDYSPYFLSSIERITFPFDSANNVLIGSLNNSRYGGASCNSSAHGFIMGGYTDGGPISFIDKMAFPLNTGTFINCGSLSTSNYLCSGINSSLHGYSMGGYPSGSPTSIIERIIFPHDSGSSSIVGNLSQSKGYSSSTSINSSTHGFYCGGYIASYPTTTSIDRILFPFDSGTATQTGNLSTQRGQNINCNSSIHGFIMGGYTSSSADSRSSVERITFPFNSGTATSVSNLTQQKSSTGGCNSTNFGYIISARYTSYDLSLIERIEFPFDSGNAIICAITAVIGCHYRYAIDNTDFVSQFV